ncbi:MAG: flagellar motor protein MotB [Alphaproteobacteria bacterium]|nr:flagellar motor protein MotB [Alphaproteobacteria bacterium]
MAGNDDQTIIIKKIKKGGGGHHGGAWKVAYADFVTAMMAFFLLLWLLNVTDKVQKEGIAEYFTPTVGLRDSLGIGFEGGESPSEDGIKKDDLTPVGIIQNSSTPGQSPDKRKDAPIEGEMESQLFEQAREEIKRAFEDDPSLREFTDQIIVEQTPEGLKIEIQDSDKKPMFLSGSTAMSEFGKEVLAKLSVIIEKMPNHISVTGHTDAEPLNAKNGTYTNWELSADRANSARRELVRTGMQKDRVGKVQGLAAQDLLLPEDPTSQRNRRITIILLKGSHFGASTYIQSRQGSILSVPEAGNVINNSSELLQEQPKQKSGATPANPEVKTPAPAATKPSNTFKLGQ